MKDYRCILIHSSGFWTLTRILKKYTNKLSLVQIKNISAWVYKLTQLYYIYSFCFEKSINIRLKIFIKIKERERGVRVLQKCQDY